MKLFLFVLAAVCSCVCVSAQIYVGGSLGFFHENSHYDPIGYDISKVAYNDVSVRPEIGYTFNNKWAVGTTVVFSWHKAKYPAVSTGDHIAFNISPYMRYSFLRKNIFSLFVDGGPSIGFINYTYGRTATGFGLGISPGITIKLCDKLYVLAHLGTLGYNLSHERDDNNHDGADSERFTFGLSNSLFFGLFYSF